MIIALEAHFFLFEFPTPVEPEWSQRVDRWYQLDAYAYGLTEAYTHWKKNSPDLLPPSLILLSSPGGSNDSDAQFTLGGGNSAHKFAHTLPNIRCSPLCQAMQWHGPILCLEQDPHTLAATLREAVTLFDPKASPLWCLHIQRTSPWNPGPEPKAYSVTLLAFHDAIQLKDSPFYIELAGKADINRPDQEILDWLHAPQTSSGAGALGMDGDYVIARRL